MRLDCRYVFLLHIIFSGVVIVLSYQPLYAQHNRTSSEEFAAIGREAKSVERIRSLLIQQNDELILQRYFGNASHDRPYNINPDYSRECIYLKPKLMILCYFTDITTKSKFGGGQNLAAKFIHDQR